MVALVADIPADADRLEENLTRLASQLLTALTRPEVLRLRRLVIANADVLPELGASWYAQGFERVLATLAATFRRLADEGLLRIDDPLQAAHHLSGLLLWIPVNKAMFHGSPQYGPEELDRYATAGVRAFLGAYR
ncbi:TetR/AcrR family transcriptional regulator C-terminal domain-containing protein [Streptomyces sp. NPDC058739]|uniref:TetR/AcrR family transcriptional regulator C-terminal domain-containing protein n=1 Tax=Streptomyces sp. NPDC058739 TaxID=3346618 RepID=UPI003685B3A5